MLSLCELRRFPSRLGGIALNVILVTSTAMVCYTVQTLTVIIVSLASVIRGKTKLKRYSYMSDAGRYFVCVCVCRVCICVCARKSGTFRRLTVANDQISCYFNTNYFFSDAIVWLLSM